MTAILHCKRYGAGEPLLILHGLFGSCDNWHPVAKALARRFCVWVPDLRNHGRSFRSPRLDYDVMAEDVQRLMDALAIDRAILLGHSMGGKAALRFAALFPERVARLIVVDVTHKARPPIYGDAIEALVRLDLNAFNRIKDVAAELQPSIPDPAVRFFLLKSLGRLPDGGFRWKVNLEAIRRNLPLISGPVDIRVFPKPSLFVRGADSNYIDPDDWPEIKGCFPQAQLATIAGAGHWPHVDNQPAFLAALSDFLAAP